MKSEEDQTETISISKSQRKREASALQEIGTKLTTFTANQLQQLPITDDIITAIEEYNRLPHSHGARRRQLQFLGRLMRECDYQELAEAVTKLEHATPMPSNKNIASTKVNGWVAQIESEGVTAIENFLNEYPDGDRQKLRHLYRNTTKLSGEKRQTQIAKLESYIRSLIG